MRNNFLKNETLVLSNEIRLFKNIYCVILKDEEEEDEKHIQPNGNGGVLLREPAKMKSFLLEISIFLMLSFSVLMLAFQTLEYKTTSVKPTQSKHM